MKSNLYTKSGDKGTTSLIDGTRTSKDHPRVDAYGDIDELSSALGFVVSAKDCPEEICSELRHIQNIMFDIGSYLATPYDEKEPRQIQGLDAEVEKLEGWIDSLDERTPKIRSFILPGGSEESSRCHMARTICRRAERKVISLSREHPVDSVLLSYLNRLSDYLFIAARYLNFITGVEEVVWTPQRK